MKSLPRILLFSLLGFAVGGVAVGVTTMTVQYHPEGVKPYQREAYAEKLRKIDELNEIVKAADPSKQPVAVVKQSTFDFGMVDPHSTLSHPFTVRNEGQLPLQLEVTQTSCKCTIGELNNDTLLPGEETTVSMTWNAGYQAEEYEQTATLATNDPLARSIILKVKGEVKAEFVAPDNIVFDTTDLGVPTEAAFLVYSQLWEDFTILDVKCEVGGFQWHAEPAKLRPMRLLDSDAKSAWEVRVFSAPLEYGTYKSKITITAQPSDGSDPVVREMVCQGKVRKPINFYHPEIHPRLGLDLGTIIAGEEHAVHVVVRTRSDAYRELAVLDVEPKGLQAELQPLSAEGSYRLTVKVPVDCPMVVFNGNHKHGYVQVGDPENKKFSNWFPLMGAVVKLDH